MSVISFDAPMSVALIEALIKSLGDSGRFKSVLTFEQALFVRLALLLNRMIPRLLTSSFSYILAFVCCNGLPQQFSHIHHPHFAFALPRVDAVFHHRHTERAPDGDDICAGLQRLPRALLVDALVLRLFDKAHSAAATATEALLAILLHLDG